MYFQDIVSSLQKYWSDEGCAIFFPYDMEVGAGTFHPETLFRALGSTPWKCAYVQPSRRPTDGRFGENPNRVQRHHQFQVMIKPAPANAQDLYIKSLETIGLSSQSHDIRFVEDDWESPTLGATGLGWEVWCDGMEISQFTYFQQIGGIACSPITLELTYGLERIAMYVQNVTNIYEIYWNKNIQYKDIFQMYEKELSFYNFDYANIDNIRNTIDNLEIECVNLNNNNLPLAAYELCLKISHSFNILDARGAISQTERANIILRIRKLSALSCSTYLKTKEEQV